MMRVTVEVMPGGNPAEKRTLMTIDITNVSPDNVSVCDYLFEAHIGGETYRDGYEGHMRQHGAIRLLGRIFGKLSTLVEHNHRFF